MVGTFPENNHLHSLVPTRPEFLNREGCARNEPEDAERRIRPLNLAHAWKSRPEVTLTTAVAAVSVRLLRRLGQLTVMKRLVAVVKGRGCSLRRIVRCGGRELQGITIDSRTNVAVAHKLAQVCIGSQ